MLDLAVKYEDEIKEKLMNIWYDDKYKFYYSSTYRSIYKVPDNGEDWNCREFVSLDSKGNVIGLINYNINRDYDLAWAFGAINFTDNKFTFGKDLIQVIDDIFCKFNMRKIEFCVVCGNPIEKSYDKLVQKYGGQIIGIRHQHCKLMDNKYYDDKMYELFKEDYIKAKNKVRKQNNSEE